MNLEASQMSCLIVFFYSAEKSGQDTVLKGDAELKLHVVKWMTTDDETHLELRDADFFPEFVSILAPLCPAVEHISIDLLWMNLFQFVFMHMPVPMRSVTTVCIMSGECHETLHDTLLAVSKSFPNADSLDLQVGDRCYISDPAYYPEVNSSSSLRELKLRYDDWYSDAVTKNGPFKDICTSCPNIESLVLSGYKLRLLRKSGKDITLCQMPHLTDIHLEPFGMDDCCQFKIFTNVIHVLHVTSPRLQLVEAKNVQLGCAELASVKWSRTSSACELQLESASAAVPMADLMHLVSNELEGVTVLTVDRCKVVFPQSTSHLPQSTGEESSLRELKFLNVKCPLSQTAIHKLSEMYPYVKVTVERERRASHEDSEQGTGLWDVSTFPKLLH